MALSGGIDSGSIAGLLHHDTGVTIEAASSTYRESTDFHKSELNASSARNNVDKWHVLTIDDDVMLEDLPDPCERIDMPLATVILYGYDYFCREVSRRGMSTLNTGVGGGLVHAGNYPSYLYQHADSKDPEPASMKRYSHSGYAGTQVSGFPRGTRISRSHGWEPPESEGAR